MPGAPHGGARTKRSSRRRRLLVALASMLAVGRAGAGIVGPVPASARVRHAIGVGRLKALAGRRPTDAEARAAVIPVLQKLVGDRWPAFEVGVAAAEPMRWIDDVLIGEGAKPGTLGQDASFFALGAKGGAFAALKGGAHGQSIELFGNLATLATWDAKHRYLEFANLDE